MPVVPLPSARVVFTAHSGPLLGATYGIAGTTRIGRKACDITLDDPTVSREHFEVRWRGGKVRVRDRATTNRTRLVVGRVKVRCPRRWFPLPQGIALEIGSGTYTIRRLPGPRKARSRLEARILVPLAMSLAMAGAMVPLAASGPAWRWTFVALPLLAGVGVLAMGTNTKRTSRPRFDPASILQTAARGPCASTNLTLPTRRMRKMELEGSTWHVTETQAIWLAGFLATHNAPGTLRVESPWLTTHGDGVTIRFAPLDQARAELKSALVVITDEPPSWTHSPKLPSKAAASRAWIELLASTHDSAYARASLPSLTHIDQSLTSLASLARTNRQVNANLAATIGVSASGPLSLDLLRDGPHAIVAGTTGAGKSELLTTWLLTLAATNSPKHLHLVLVDFKGGAAFGPLAELPHAVSLLTDLDPSATARALTSIQAILRARERILAAAKLRDITEYSETYPGQMPRMLIVVDEFRALADDHPDILSQLLRLGAQGRSLGVHLILATQRPAGAVGPDLRANVGLRIALRVTESADSHDVISSSAAASLPQIPGRAIVRTDHSTEFQVAWAGELEKVRGSVARIAGFFGADRPQLPWLAELPAQLPPEALPPSTIGLLDEPDLLEQNPLPFPRGHAVVAGPSRSGRTTASLAFAAAALHAGREVWLVSAADLNLPASRFGWGGLIHSREVRLIASVLDHIAERRGRTLVFDDVDLWIGLYDGLHGVSAAHSLLAGNVRAAAAAGSNIILLGGAELMSARGMSTITDRFVLSGFDQATQSLAGVPRHLLSAALPGRAAALSRNLLLQFGSFSSQDFTQRIDELTDAKNNSARSFLPLPEWCDVPDIDGRLPLGVGGPDADVISVPIDEDLVVVGTAGDERERAYAVGKRGTGLALEVTPAQWASGYGGELGAIRDHAAVVVVRPDVLAPVPGLNLAEALEIGSPGYAVLAYRGEVVPFRVASTVGGRRVSPPERSVVEEAGGAGVVDVVAGFGVDQHEDRDGRQHDADRSDPAEVLDEREGCENDKEMPCDDDTSGPRLTGPQLPGGEANE